MRKKLIVALLVCVNLMLLAACSPVSNMGTPLQSTSETPLTSTQATPTTKPAFSPTLNPKIVYSHSSNSNSQIYIMNVDGSNQTALTPAGNYSQPALSQDGTEIAFVLDQSIYKMDVDGRNITRLTNVGIDSTPAWSSDGTQIAYSSGRNIEEEIYIINANGNNPVRLTGGNENNPKIVPTWSPDGSRIAYIQGDPEAPNKPGYVLSYGYIADADGSNPERIISDYQILSMAWSPDGAKIAFTGNLNRDSQIYVMDINGTDVTKLTQTGVNGIPSWSPDGSKIAFQSNRSGSLEIWVMDSDGSHQTQLTTDGDQGGNRWPSFAPPKPILKTAPVKFLLPDIPHSLPEPTISKPVATSVAIWKPEGSNNSAIGGAVSGKVKNHPASWVA